MRVQVHLRQGNTISDLLMAPRDKYNITSKGGVIYRCKCDHLGCTMGYIGETGRTFGDRYKAHLRALYPTHEHTNTMSHPIKLDNFSIMERESQGVTRTIKEAKFIRVNDPSLNRNLGKYQLPHIWYEVLQKHQLSIYSDTPYILPLSHLAPSTYHGAHAHHTGKYGPQGDAFPPCFSLFLMASNFHTIFWHQKVGMW